MFDLVRQVLGLTYELLRKKAVKLIGEKNVALIEQVTGYLKTLITKGWKGFFEQIKGQLGGLKDTVLNALKEFLVTRVILAAVTKLGTMFNPVGAIVQLVIMAWQFFTFIRDQLARLVQLLQALVKSVSEIAAKKLKPAAKRIEEVLANLLPIAIDLLARLLGLGGIAKKVQEVLKKVQKRIEVAITWLIKQARSLFRRKARSSKLVRRTNKQKKSDLEKATKATKSLLEDERIPMSKLNTQIQKTKSKYKLSVLKFHIKSKSKTKRLFSVEAAINPTDSETAERENRFDIILFSALKDLGKQEYVGYTAEEIARGKQSSISDRSKTIDDDIRKDANKLQILSNAKDKEILKKAEGIHREIAIAQKKYSVAAQAEFYPNNTFRLGEGVFFVATQDTNYVVPDEVGKKIYKYYSNNQEINALIKSLDITIISKKQSANNEENKLEKLLNNPKIPAKNKTILKNKKTELVTFIDLLKDFDKDYNKLNDKKPEEYIVFVRKWKNRVFPVVSGIRITNTLEQLTLDKKFTIGVGRDVTGVYDYSKLTVKEAKLLYRNFPKNIKDANIRHTRFVAVPMKLDKTGQAFYWYRL